MSGGAEEGPTRGERKRPPSAGRTPGGLRAALTSPTAKKVYIALAVLVVVGLWVNAVHRALHGSSQWRDFTGFSRDLLFRDINIYETYAPHFTITKYPPFFGLLFAPLVPLPGWLGASIWYWANLAMAVAATWLAVATVDEGPRGRRLRLGFYLIPFLLAAGIVGSNLETSQVNIVLLFLVVLSLYAFERRKETTAGLILGLATAIKLTPALFVAYFAWKRSWKVVVGAVLGLVVCWGVVLPAALGFGDYLPVMESWLHDVAPFLTEGTAAEGVGGFRHTNQSLSAALHRHLTRTPAGAGREDLYLNLVAVAPETMRWAVNGLVVGLVLLLGWLCRTPTDSRRDFRLSLEYSVVFVAGLFISPISWINHYVVLLFPFAAAVYYLRTRPREHPRRRTLLRVLVAAVVLLLGAVARITQAFSLPFLGAAVLFGGMAWLLRRESGDPTVVPARAARGE